jgi:5'-deoxynucleotidase YfbR-like HD superfamily hydrolase
METPPSADRITEFMADVIVPIYTVDRTMVMPFDRERKENTGEHSAALTILAGMLAPAMDPKLDLGKIAQFAIVHDIVEIHAGDVTVWDADHIQQTKAANERKAATRIATEFPDFPWITKTYDEYEERDTAEARYVYALDKIYPHLMVIAGDYHPVHPSWDSYSKREEVAREKITNFPVLLPLFDDVCAIFRQKPQYFSTAIPKNEVAAAERVSVAQQTRDAIDIVANVISPLFEVPRTMVMPFDLERHENAGEHELTLGMLACSLVDKYDPTLNKGLIAQYALAHEIAKIHTGDVTVWESEDVVRKNVKDSELAVEYIEKSHPAASWVTQTYLSYLKLDTQEKRFSYALDTMMAHMMVLVSDHHPIRPSWEAYKHTEDVARAKVERYPMLIPLFDDICKKFRQNSGFFSTPIPPQEIQ